MKKYLFLLVTVFALNRASAQTTPTIVIIHFTEDYPSYAATWAIEDCYHRVVFFDKENETLRSLVYDRAGYVICRDWKMSSNYPKRISDYYTSVYPNESYAVWSSIDDSGTQKYYIIRNSEKIWFDRNGKIKNCVVG